MEFLCCGNIFIKFFIINLCKRSVIFEGGNIFSKIPLPPQESTGASITCTALCDDCQNPRHYGVKSGCLSR